MKFYFFIFLFLVLLPFSYATLSGSPDSLNFNLDIGEEKCLIFVVSSSDYSSDLTSIMRWAEKDADVSSLNDFVLNNSEVGLNVEYSPETVSDFDGEEEIEVCVSGYEIGSWKGSLEFRTESSGNIGVGVGTWLRVNVTEKVDDEEDVEDVAQVPPASSGSSGSSSNGDNEFSTTNDSSSALVGLTVLDSENESVELDVPLGELEDEVVSEDVGFWSGVTGSVVGGVSSSSGIIVIVLVCVGIVGVVVYRRKNR